MCYVIRFGSFITCKTKTDVYACTKSVSMYENDKHQNLACLPLKRWEVNGVKVYTGEVSIIFVLCSLKKSNVRKFWVY